MKVLWIKQGPLFPPDSGGKLRSLNILEQLAKAHDLIVLTVVAKYTAEGHVPPDRHIGRLISMQVEMPVKNTAAYRLDYLRKCCSPIPYVVRQYGNPAVHAEIARLLAADKFDVVVCDFIFPSLNLPDHGPCPQVLFAHNAETTIWKRHFDVAYRALWKIVTGIEYLKMRRFESRRCRRFDHVVTVSSVDREFFSRFVPSSQLSVLPTGVDLEYFHPADVPEKPLTLVFTGSMDWLANEDAILFFADRILPILLRSKPGLTLTVVGRNPTERLRRLALLNPHIRLTGTVSDVRPYVNEAAVYVLPLQVGSGTRLKVFEAMAMGKAIVSTQVGVEGLPVVAGEHLVIADEPNAFAEAVLRLLDDASLRQGLGQAARRLVEGGYGWSEVGRAFDQILRLAVNTSQTQPNASVPSLSPAGRVPSFPKAQDEFRKTDSHAIYPVTK